LYDNVALKACNLNKHFIF